MQLSDFGVRKQQTILDNGVPLVVYERPGMPISLRIAFFSGSRFDPINKEGLAHFAEHMILSGTKKYPTKRDISTFVERLGASFNGSTNGDKMDLVLDYADIADTPAMMELLEQFLTESLFDSATLENERGAILTELAGKLSDPSVYIHRLWKAVAYQGSPLNRDTIGTDESILAITKNDLQDYYHHQLTANRAVIVASGDITTTELARMYNSASFIRTADDADFSLPWDNIERAYPIMIHNYPKSEQSHIAFGFVTVPETHPDFWPIFVLSRVLGGSRSARLNQRLRFELGLVYSTYARVDNWYGLGRLVAHASCKTQNQSLVLDEIGQIFHQLSQESVTLEELEHVKTFTKKVQKLRMQTSAAWVGYHINRFLLYPNQDISIAEDLRSIQEVTLERVNEVAQKYIVSNAWYLAVCGDTSATDITVNF